MNDLKTYDVRTHGCQMNVHDSERLAGLLETAGYVDLASLPAGERPEVADVVDPGPFLRAFIVLIVIPLLLAVATEVLARRHRVEDVTFGQDADASVLRVDHDGGADPACRHHARRLPQRVRWPDGED